MTAVTPGTVSDVSAMFVATMMRRLDVPTAAARGPARRRRAIRAAARRRRRRRSARLEVGHRAADLGRAGQKAQHVAGRRPQQRRPRRRPPTAPARTRSRPDAARPGTSTPDSRRETPTPARVERRRHHDDAQVVARAPRLARQRDRQIGVDAALVELVEDDRREIGEQRIGLQPRGQDAFGDDEQAGVGAEAAVEAHLPADLAAERPAALVGDPRGDRARRHATRLQQDDRAVGDQRRRDARRLAGARRGGDDRGPRAPDVIDDLIEERIDRERNRIEQLNRGDRRDRREGSSRRALRSLRLNVTRSRRRRPGSSRRCRRGRSSRPGSSRGTAGGSPRRSRTRAPARSRW